jgi:hypothetical protein
MAVLSFAIVRCAIDVVLLIVAMSRHIVAMRGGLGPNDAGHDQRGRTALDGLAHVLADALERVQPVLLQLARSRPAAPATLSAADEPERDWPKLPVKN